MTHRKRFFTSESVTEGHPDKLADQISDAVPDAVLSQDPGGRVACETLLKGNRVIVAGEISTAAMIDHEEVVHRTLLRVGYEDAVAGIDGRHCEITSLFDGQSPEIEEMVKSGGAGDQGLMFGYACRETDTLMPLPITWPTAWPSAWRRCAGRACCRTCVPTASPRLRWSTWTGSPAMSRRWW